MGPQSREKNAAAVAEIGALGVQALAQCVDVSKEEQVVAGFADAVARVGRIDCVVQNAGFSNPALSFAAMTSAQWHAQLDVALHGGFYTLRGAARHMIARAESGNRGGSILLCGSGTIFGGLRGRSIMPLQRLASRR